MKKALVIVLLLAMMGLVFPSVDFPLSSTVYAEAAPNLLTGTQGTFESGSIPAGWFAFGGGTLSASSTVSHSGSYALKLAGRTQTWYSPALNIYDTIKANGAGTYFLSIWVYVDALASSPGTGRLVIRGASSADENSFILNKGSGNYYGVLTSTISTPVNTWTNYTASLEVLESDLTRETGTFNFMIDYLAGSAGQNLYFDDVSIYKPQTNTECWNMEEISFTSGYDGLALFTGDKSTFESGSVPAGWSAFSGGTLSASSVTAYSGTYSLGLAGRTQSWYSPQYNIYDILKANGPGQYNISFYVYTDTLAVSPSNGRIVIRGASANQYSFFPSGQSYGPISSTISTSVNTWTLYSGSVIVTAADLTEATGNMNLMVDTLPGASGQNLYIDDVQITKSFYSFDDATLDVTFTAPDGTSLVMPAFWDGGYTWKVRFAPTMIGAWHYTTACSNTLDTGLHGQTGTIGCIPYTGDLAIYQKGFVETVSGNRYFSYADGTPFFYIGDTHWGMPVEPLESVFQTIVDDRAEKGFTVYQSEPIGAGYNLRNGLTAADLAGFADMDARFAYIADAGLVHANAQLFFTSELQNYGTSYSAEYLQKLSRYWVARYAAYPVMWTTAQECDNDFFGAFDLTTSPWKTVFNAIHQYDPYQHPQSAHQENTSQTKASNSAYKDLSGHSWFANQWGAPAKNAVPDFNVPKDYWNYGGSKPSVMYESHYENLYTNQFGARMQGWVAYLNGMYGYGYGAQDMWYYQSTYAEDYDSTYYGITITAATKQATTWDVSMAFDTSTQLADYMQSFFGSMNWWQLTPRFDDTTYFANNSSYYSVASISNDTYVAYFYNTTTNTGTLKNMDSTSYTAKWFNPRTGAYTTIGTVTPSDGQWTIPAKPDGNDWVLVVYQ